MTDTGAELSEFPVSDPGCRSYLPHEFNQELRSIMTVQSGGSGGYIFFAGKDIPEFVVFFFHIFFIRIEDLRDAAPARILDQLPAFFF